MNRLIYMVILTFGCAECYNVLGLFPYAGKSHFYVFEALMKGLADKGHSVTVISQFPQKSAHANYEDVVLPPMSEAADNSIAFDDLPNSRLRLYFSLYVLHMYGTRDCRTYLQSQVFKDVIESNERYDVIVVESFNTDCFLSVVNKLNAPFILISSSTLMPWNYAHMGNPDNPSYIPNHVMDYTDRLTFLQRVENSLVYVLSNVIYKWSMVGYADKIAAETFGPGEPRPSDLAKNASLLFVNSHYSISLPKPMVPGLIEIGGIHIGRTKAKQIPKNIEEWINDSKDGVIYFSMGSMIKGHTFPEEKRQIFMRVFGRMRQRVLWKWENDTMPDKPENVMIQKWMPQFDILCHPNVKAYISHGGLLGTTEAVHCGVPALVMPQFGDQHTNAKALEASGGGVVLNFNDLTEETVYNALKTILEPSFQKQTKELRDRFLDRPMPPLETAVYWVEYVARHKGARHMRTAAVDMPLYQYLLLDVIGFLIIVLAVILFANYLVLRALFRKLFAKNKTKMKTK